MSLVTIMTAFNPADAQLARARLEAAGFEPVLVNELANLSLGRGGTLVQVPAEEAEEAKAFLAAEDPPPA